MAVAMTAAAATLASPALYEGRHFAILHFLLPINFTRRAPGGKDAHLEPTIVSNL